MYFFANFSVNGEGDIMANAIDRGSAIDRGKTVVENIIWSKKNGQNITWVNGTS